MRLIKRTLLVLLVLLVAAVAGGGMFLRGFITKERLVAQLEAALPCKVSVTSVESSLFSIPATISIHGLLLSPLNPEDKASEVKIDLAQLKVRLFDLIFRKITVDQLLLSGVYLKDEVSKESQSSLAQMLKEPKEESAPQQRTAEPVSVATAPPVVETASPEAPVEVEVTDEKGRSASLAFAVKEALVEKATVHFLDRKNLNKTELTDLRFRLYDVDVDPNDLASHNQCKLELSGHAMMYDRRNKEWIELVKAPFNGSGQVRPLDPASGLPLPEALFAFSIPKGSQLDGVRTLGEMAGKGGGGLDKVKDFLGIDLAKLPLGGVLQEDITIRLQVKGNHVQWQEDTHMSFPDYRFTLKQGSWLDSAVNDSRMEFICLPSVDMSKNLLSGVTKSLGDGMAANVQKVFDGGSGQLAIPFNFGGPLDKLQPSVPPDTLRKLFETMGGGLLNGLLGGQK
jgi:hypothetical protein